jgi:hypothetical protein
MKTTRGQAQESGRTHSKRHREKARYQGPDFGPCETVAPDGSSRFWPSYADAMRHRRRGEVVAELAPGEEIAAPAKKGASA